MDAKEALIKLSALAADFNTGVYPAAKVREIIEAIVASMNLSEEESKKLVSRLMRYWYDE